MQPYPMKRLFPTPGRESTNGPTVELDLEHLASIIILAESDFDSNHVLRLLELVPDHARRRCSVVTRTFVRPVLALSTHAREFDGVSIRHVEESTTCRSMSGGRPGQDFCDHARQYGTKPTSAREQPPEGVHVAVHHKVDGRE